MPAARAPRWNRAEVAVLRSIYAEQGLKAAMALLPGRSSHSIYVKAHKLGLRTDHRPTRTGVYRQIAGRALDLYERLGSYSAVAIELGVCEATATNAVHHARAVRSGHQPLERDRNGKITAAAIDRLRQLFRKGLTHRDIQRLTGASAATLTRERRRYETWLKARGLAPIPPRNHGEAYSGNRVPRAKKAEVERLFLEGYGTAKVSLASGVSKTVCTRLRNRLIKRLRRKGECLPGCDIDGVRRVHKDSARLIPQEAIDQLRAQILAGVPVIRAARLLGIGGSSAYRIRDALQAEVEARGESLPAPEWRGQRRRAVPPIPGGAKGIYRFRKLAQSMPADQARARLEREIAAARHAAEQAARPKTFEEQLQAVAEGRVKLVENVPLRRPDPAFSPGGSQLADIA